MGQLVSHLGVDVDARVRVGKGLEVVAPDQRIAFGPQGGVGVVQRLREARLVLPGRHAADGDDEPGAGVALAHLAEKR